MPELPEVEIVRQSLEKKVRDKIIQKVLIKNRNLITDDQIRLLDQTFGARKGLIDESYNQALLKTAMDNHAEKATDLNFKYHYGDEEAGWPGLLAYQKEYVMRDYRDDEEIREHEADWRDLNVKRMERYLINSILFVKIK